MDQDISERRAKMEREERLRWQSPLLLVVVLSGAIAGLATLVWRLPTSASTEGLVICALFGLLVWLLRAATPLASLTGFVLTSCMYLATVEQPSGGWFHTALPPGLALFVLAFAATRFRRRDKEQSGLAESRRGRTASQVMANMGAAALVVLCPVFIPSHFARTTAIAALIAALAEAAADTVSSEIGQALGGTPVLVTTGKRVPRGTDGAITLAGTAAGCIAAALLVLTAVPALGIGIGQAVAVWLAAICGLFIDSYVGATAERLDLLNNDMVNFVSTAGAALLALIWVRWIHI